MEATGGKQDTALVPMLLQTKRINSTTSHPNT